MTCVLPFGRIATLYPRFHDLLDKEVRCARRLRSLLFVREDGRLERSGCGRVRRRRRGGAREHAWSFRWPDVLERPTERERRHKTGGERGPTRDDARWFGSGCSDARGRRRLATGAEGIASGVNASRHVWASRNARAQRRQPSGSLSSRRSSVRRSASGRLPSTSRSIMPLFKGSGGRFSNGKFIPAPRLLEF